jgi:aspartate aminotransferase-like enzyme
MLLMNPGPVTLSERVRRSLLQPDLCDRKGEFFDLQDEARSRLPAVYGLDPARAASRAYYLDLGRLGQLQNQRNTLFTPAVHAYYALVEALRRIRRAGGGQRVPGITRRWPNRYAQGSRHTPDRGDTASGAVVGRSACVPVADGTDSDRLLTCFAKLC